MLPLVDLTKQYKEINREINRVIKQVLENGEFILGEEVEKFENEFSKYCQTKYAIGVASGTDAILLALRALGIGKNDEVITVATTYISTVLPIISLGAKPVLVDIDPKTYTLDVNQIEPHINKNTKAIIPVHLYGQPAAMNKINYFAKSYNLFVIEDACQAHGAYYYGQRVGSVGDIGCFSFYPGKNLGAYGDGGGITTNNKRLAESIKILRNVGQKKKNLHVEKGYNSRLDSLQAAVLRVKLKHLDKWNTERSLLAQHYTELLKSLPVIKPLVAKGCVSNYHLYVIQTPLRNKLYYYLRSENIACGIHYPIPVHLQPCMKDLGYKKGDFPISEFHAKRALSLPLFPELTKKDIEVVVEKIKRFFAYH